MSFIRLKNRWRNCPTHFRNQKHLISFPNKHKKPCTSKRWKLFNYHSMLIKDIVNRLRAKQFPFRVLVNLTINTVNFLSIFVNNFLAFALLSYANFICVFLGCPLNCRCLRTWGTLFEVYVRFILFYLMWPSYFNCCVRFSRESPNFNSVSDVALYPSFHLHQHSSITFK